jgi:hypothetical protein
MTSNFGIDSITGRKCRRLAPASTGDQRGPVIPSEVEESRGGTLWQFHRDASSSLDTTPEV